jgi:tetratricopeptide (TPR) repeat protein
MEGDSYMTDNKEQNFQWLRDITKKIKALNEGSLFSENILKIIINIALKYKENETHLWQEQIPYKIFKKLVSILLEKSENLVSEDFYRELKSLPYNHIIIQPFVEQQEISLLNYYDQILEQEPDNLEILLKRAVAYYKDNVLEYSLIDLEKILEINPGEKRAIKYKIKAQVKLEKYVEAYQELNLLLNINPDNEFALFERALLYLKFNYRDLAYTDIQKLEKSKEIEYLLLVCSLYYENNCIEKTINICLRILEEVPDETEALMSLGKAYFKKQEYEKAIVTFDLVLKITAPTAYLAKYHYQILSAMKYISDAKCQMNYYAEGIQGYLEIMALGGSNYFLKREYVK